ncbi:MAG: CinA family nicotinamide mononucleotide deamidase-related protein [Phycisphaerales bacterium]
MSGGPHERVGVVSIGDEICLGQKLDTNSRWIAQRLSDSGALVGEHASVPDDAGLIAATFERLARDHDLVVTTGGLGPTADDLTREGLARAMGEELVEDAGALEWITAYVRARGREMTETQRTQTMRPSGARCLKNDAGTAAGLVGRVGACDVVCLPGPPREMRPMFEGWARDGLRIAAGARVWTRFVHACGIAEADAAQRLGGLLARDRNPMVGITVSETVITLRMRYRGEEGEARARLDEAEKEARGVLGAHVFGAGEETLAGSVLRRLIARGETVVCAESCTAGMLGAAFGDVAGASGAFLGGWVTYSNEMKAMELGVARELVARVGAVSEEVARAMSEGALVNGDADHALSVTGVAGPSGGSEEKPVGTVFIARSWREKGMARTEVRRFLFRGERAVVRLRSVQSALSMLHFGIEGVEGVRLLAERGLKGD